MSLANCDICGERWVVHGTACKPVQSGSFAAPLGSADVWKRLAMHLANDAEICLDNAHWEVRCGSGHLRETIKTVRELYLSEMQNPPNTVLSHTTKENDSPK